MLIRVLEKPLKDRETLLECRNKNFQHVIAIMNKREDEKRGQQKKFRDTKRPFEEKGFGKDLGEEFNMQNDGLKGNSRLSLALNTGFKFNSSSVGEGLPIIIVPESQRLPDPLKYVQC